jgi:hypothetical protein
VINPVQGDRARLMLDLNGVVNGIEVKLFGVSEVLERSEAFLGNFGPGWVEIDLDCSGLADGIYYAQANGVVAKWVKLR